MIVVHKPPVTSAVSKEKSASGTPIQLSASTMEKEDNNRLKDSNGTSTMSSALTRSSFVRPLSEKVTFSIRSEVLEEQWTKLLSLRITTASSL